MFAVLWDILFTVATVGFTFLTGEVAAELVGVGSGLGLTIGLADDVLLWIIKGSLTAGETFALQIFLDEVEKIGHETVIYAEEDDAQRHARHAALVRWHGNKVYLFGDVHLEDAALLWFSGRELAQTELAQSAFQYLAEEVSVLL